MTSNVRPLRMQDIEDPDLPFAYALLREQAEAIGCTVTVNFAGAPIELVARRRDGAVISSTTIRGKLSAAMRATAAAIKAAAAE